MYEDLLYWYVRDVRPVQNASDAVTVKFGASLIRIIDLDEVNQVFTTNLWLDMVWCQMKAFFSSEKELYRSGMTTAFDGIRTTTTAL